MRLIPVRDNLKAYDVLYELLAERPRIAWISHGVMPSRAEHDRFVTSHPYLHWYLIEADWIYVGAIEANDRNEIGIAILERYQHNGYGAEAFRRFREMHRPLPAVKAVRSGHWLANIATGNEGSKVFFGKLGFKKVQETWQL